MLCQPRACLHARLSVPSAGPSDADVAETEEEVREGLRKRESGGER